MSNLMKQKSFWGVVLILLGIIDFYLSDSTGSVILAGLAPVIVVVGLGFLSLWLSTIATAILAVAFYFFGGMFWRDTESYTPYWITLAVIILAFVAQIIVSIIIRSKKHK